MPHELAVLYEDNHCLALAKPAPLLTQAPPGVPSLEAMAKAYLKAKYNKAGNVYLGIPHRLDRPVSGVVVFARNTKAARRLAEQFRDRQVRKVYWALVEAAEDGSLPRQEGAWEEGPLTETWERGRYVSAALSATGTRPRPFPGRSSARPGATSAWHRCGHRSTTGRGPRGVLRDRAWCRRVRPRRWQRRPQNGRREG